MFDDETPQHAEDESTYTPAQVIRKDFELLWQTIIHQCGRSEPYERWPMVADEIIDARLRLYERAGLLRAAE